MIKLIAAVATGLALLGASFFAASAADEARVRVIHASPDAPAVDVYANGSRVLSDVRFKASSGYMTVPAGNYQFEVFAAGANPDTDGPVLTVSADLEAGTDYTVMAVDSLSQIKARIFVDDNTAPAAGKAHVNVIHAGPNAPAVDVAVAGGPVLVGDLGFGSKAGPLPIDSGTYDLELRPAGTSSVALPLPGIELESGNIYTFVATGYLDAEPALTVVAYSETPAASVTPPSAGDGGLLVNSGGNTALYALAALVTVISLAGAVRLVAAWK
jgi:hypothetical protein